MPTRSNIVLSDRVMRKRYKKTTKIYRNILHIWSATATVLHIFGCITHFSCSTHFFLYDTRFPVLQIFLYDIFPATFPVLQIYPATTILYYTYFLRQQQRHTQISVFICISMYMYVCTFVRNTHTHFFQSFSCVTHLFGDGSGSM